MIKSLRHLFPLATLTMVLLLALPVAAQQSDNPSGDPSQRDPAPSPEICVPVGTALAVLADDAVLAKIIGPATRNVDPAAATGRVITLDGPATVGACGQAQGYWDDGVTGFAAANLDLLGANAVSLTSPVASDAYKADRTGPATDGAALRAMVQLTRPGTYPFVALFRVRAGRPAATAAQPGDQAADEVKVAFTVVIRGRGTISGRVMSGGQPVAGATVRADAPRTASVRSGAVELPPVDLPGVLGGEASDSRLASTTAVTNRNGEYTLAVPTGKYVVAAQARGLKVQWYHLKDSARDADPVAVTPDALAVTGVDFDLVAPDRPQPAKAGTITGRVVDEDGNPVAGATVTASGPATSRDPAGGANITVVAATDAQGVYELQVPAGAWLVMASAAFHQTQWYQGKDSARAADKVVVAADARVEQVDFRLLTLPHAVISGVVLDKDGKPVAKALVVTMRRPDPNAPATGDRTTRGPTTVTDDEGRYRLWVEPATWAVGAGAARNSAAVATVWWRDKTKLEEADLLTLADGDLADFVDFQLP